jgi:hypothetical protein
MHYSCSREELFLKEHSIVLINLFYYLIYATQLELVNILLLIIMIIPTIIYIIESMELEH